MKNIKRFFFSRSGIVCFDSCVGCILRGAVDNTSNNTAVNCVCYRAIVKSSPEIVRSSLLPFFTFAADDLAHTVANLKIGRFSHVKGTITRGMINHNHSHKNECVMRRLQCTTDQRRII